MVFNEINIKTTEPYLEIWKKTQQKSSDYSSAVLLCWERAMGYEMFIQDIGLAWIRGREPEEHMLAPSGDWSGRDWGNVIQDLGDCLIRGGVAEFRLVPEVLANIWKEQFGDAMEVIENRASWEYLHDVSELASLSGNKYMRKRNRVNQFRKQVPYEYRTLVSDALPAVADFQQEWCESWRGYAAFDSVHAESEGIIRSVLGNWGAIPGLMGGAIVTDEGIAAYTIAEDAGDGIVMIHFEKASPEHNAAYQVINKEFLSREGGRFKTVNREEDMDDPGLREAKTSYHPSGFVKKYTVRIKF
jgi:hypothetical protein